MVGISFHTLIITIYTLLNLFFLFVFKKMIWLISDRLERGLCDDVLEVAWSTMWNVTDETPPNCKKFLENKGMEYFLKCLEVILFFAIHFYPNPV